MHPRTASGQAQRAKTRAWIIQCAIPVFATLGPDVPTIDDFVKAAGIARGTFYNYFQSTRELLDAVMVALSDNLAESIASAVSASPNPVIRLASAASLYYRRAIVDPLFIVFLRAVPSIGELSIKYGRRTLQEAIDAELIRISDIDFAEAIVLGIMVFALRISHSPQSIETRALDVARATLAALGVAPGLIARAMRAVETAML